MRNICFCILAASTLRTYAFTMNTSRGDLPSRLSLLQIKIPVSAATTPSDLIKTVEEKCNTPSQKLVRWHIASVDKESGFAEAEAVVISTKVHEAEKEWRVAAGQKGEDNTPRTSRREVLNMMSVSFPAWLMTIAASNSNNFDLYDYGLKEPSFTDAAIDDAVKIFKRTVRSTSDSLIEANTKLNEQVYVLQKKAEGKEINRTRSPQRPIEKDFAEAAYRIPETVYKRMTGINDNQLRQQIKAMEEKYRRFFQGSSGYDLTNHAIFNFATYCQWKVFAGGLKTKTVTKEFTLQVGSEARKTILSDVSLKVYNARVKGPEEALNGCIRLLEKFQSVGFIEGFALDSNLIDSTSLVDGDPCTFSLILDREAALGAKIQLDFEGLKTLLPNIVAGSLASYLTECNASPMFECYYLSDQYTPGTNRPEPTQTLIEWSLGES